MEPPSGDGGDSRWRTMASTATSLQWSRRRVTAETLEVTRLVTDGTKLQWSRRRVTAETIAVTHWPDACYRASMEPPSGDGGDASDCPESSAYRGLQWSRRRVTAETCDRPAPARVPARFNGAAVG